MQSRQPATYRSSGLAAAGRIGLGLVWLAVAGFSCGCVSDHYRYGLEREGAAEPLSGSAQSLTVAFGQPPAHLARLEKVVQLPRQVVRQLSGRRPLEPEEELAGRAAAVSLAEEYLLANGLEDLNIDVRIYDPGEQWRRLRSNDRMHPLVRYTGGTLGWLRYTLLPRTVFRSDHYDPFTRTLSLNSDHPARAILESARVKEFNRDRWIGPGAYAMLQSAPLFPLLHESRAASDALTFSEHHLEGDWQDQLYPLAYARIGSAAVSEALSVVTFSPGTPLFVRPLLIGSGNLTGRSVGRWMSSAPPQPSSGDSQD